MNKKVLVIAAVTLLLGVAVFGVSSAVFAYQNGPQNGVETTEAAPLAEPQVVREGMGGNGNEGICDGTGECTGTGDPIQQQLRDGTGAGAGEGNGKQYGLTGEGQGTGPQAGTGMGNGAGLKNGSGGMGAGTGTGQQMGQGAGQGQGQRLMDGDCLNTDTN